MIRYTIGRVHVLLCSVTAVSLPMGCGVDAASDGSSFEDSASTQAQRLESPAHPSDELHIPHDDALVEETDTGLDGVIATQMCLEPLDRGTWSTPMQGTAQLDGGHAVATDLENCAIYTGGETGASLGGQPYAGNSDAFLTRYSMARAVVWTRQLGGGSFDSISDIAVDSEHNVYVTGFTYNTLPGSPSPARGGRDVFLVKYDDAGNRQWTRQIGTAGSDTGSGVAIGTNDEIYVAGTTGGLLPLATAYAGGSDFFIARFDTAGTHVSTWQMGGPGADEADDIAVGLAGNLHLVGRTDGTLNVADGNQGGDDLFVAKYDLNGAQLWIHQRGSSGQELAAAIAVNDDGQIFLTGSTNGQFDGNASHGSWDSVVLRYDANGTWQWTDQRGTAGMDLGLGIAVNSFGHAFSVGSTDGALDGNVHQGGVDMYLMKHGHSGVWRFTRQYGTSSYDVASAISMDSVDHGYVVGTTQGAFGTATNAGADDIFTTRWDSAGLLD